MDYAYVTLATSRKYLKYAQYLQISLKRVKAKIPLIIMITQNLANEIEILRDFDNYIIIPYEKFSNKNQFCQRYDDTLCKFFCYTLTEFKKVCFLDSDLFLIQNIDYLFNEVKDFSFVSSMYRAGYCNREIVPRAGFMFLTPKEGKYEEIIKLVKEQSLQNLPMTDETILKYYLFPQMITFSWDKDCSTFESLNLRLNELIFIHGKWHYRLNIDPINLLYLTDDEILNLAISYWETRKYKKDYKSLLILKGSLNDLL